MRTTQDQQHAHLKTTLNAFEVYSFLNLACHLDYWVMQLAGSIEEKGVHGKVTRMRTCSCHANFQHKNMNTALSFRGFFVSPSTKWYRLSERKVENHKRQTRSGKFQLAESLPFLRGVRKPHDRPDILGEDTSPQNCIHIVEGDLQRVKSKGLT